MQFLECMRTHMMRHSLFIVTLLLVFLCVLRSEASQRSPKHITPEQLFQLIHVGAPPPIVDVRSAAEYKRGHVPAALHIPFWRILGNTAQLATYKDQPIVVYCEHGPRAALAKAALRLSGFSKILYLQGHLRAWREAGLPLVRGPFHPPSPSP